MWSLKFLSGPKAGKEILLQKGLVILGREANCQISIPSQGISKKHAQILVKETGLTIEDLDSRNGIFIKGKQVRKEELKEGDRVALYNVIFEVRKKDSLPAFQIYGLPYPQNPPNTENPPRSFKGENETNQHKKFINTKNSLLKNIYELVQSYINDVILPGVYKLAEWIEFKILLASFVIGFIVLVTALSAFPLISILKASVEQESFNNAENIAITLARSNRNPLKKGLQEATNVDYALRRPGVDKAFIISAIDGRILAPAELAHTYPKSSLIHKARKRDEKTVEKEGSSIVAVVPISFPNIETGENIPRAYSVVIYNMDSLGVGTKKVASLVIQTFLIACVIGFLLFFFLINLVEFPIKSINRQLERTLTENKAPSISIDYQSQILTDLCSHINSALNQISLNRMLSEKEGQGESLEINRQNEMNNLVEVIGFPAMSINIEEETVAGLNSNFTEQLGFAEILHQPLSEIPDSNLKDHLLTLIEQGKSNPQEISFDEISLNHIKLQSSCQFVMGKKSPAYAIITFMPPELEEGAA